MQSLGAEIRPMTLDERVTGAVDGLVASGPSAAPRFD